jgi:hypothetical protein
MNPLLSSQGSVIVARTPHQGAENPRSSRFSRSAATVLCAGNLHRQTLALGSCCGAQNGTSAAGRARIEILLAGLSGYPLLPA